LDNFHIQIVFTWIAAVIASCVVSLPLMYQNAKSAFISLDPIYEKAAQTLGSSEWKTFRTVVFPLAWPGIISGIALSFARAIGEFGATLMVAGNIPGKTQTIPTAIYFAVESGIRAGQPAGPDHDRIQFHADPRAERMAQEAKLYRKAGISGEYLFECKKRSGSFYP
jgi:ABC-type molybdate transport system permease subunit